MTEAIVSTLPNGLRVASLSMPSVETAAVALWVDVGSRYESAEMNGLAHFVEHMMFKGTEKRTALQIAEEVDAVGGHLNAFTSREHTVYHVKILKEHLELGMDVIADIAFNATIEPSELERERGVVLQEIAQAEDDPDDLVFDFVQDKAFPQHPLGRRILGSVENVKRFTRADMQNYLKQHYYPENMVLAVAGNVEHNNIVKLAEKYFKTTNTRGSSVHLAGEYKGGENIIKRDLEQLHLVLSFKSISLHHPDYYVLQVLISILGGGMSSRLFQEVREKRGLCYAIQPYISNYAETGLLSIYSGTAADKADELLNVVIHELKDLTQNVSAEELSRAKAQLKSSLFMERESCAMQAEELGRQVLCFQKPIPTQEMVSAIEAVSATDIKRLTKEIISSLPTLAAIGNVAHMPSLAHVERLLKL